MTSQELAALIEALHALRDRGFADGAALATLVRTRGPVFRRAGARMLVLGDGRVVRGLSAGCPEADIVQRANEVIASGHAAIVRYDREHGYDALLELGCGGDLEVLVEPLRGSADLRFIEAAANCAQARRSGLLLTLFARDGRCLPQPRRLLWAERVLLDELDDPRLSDAALSQALSQPASGAGVMALSTRSGAYEMLVEPLLPSPALVLVGVNTTSLALAGLGAGLGWQCVLVDHREGDAPSEMPRGCRLLRASEHTLRQRIAFDARTAVVVMTHNLERDLACLQALRDAPVAYLGALGSRARAARMRNALGDAGTRLRAPAGLDIGSETPEEIALAIAAEILGVLAGHGGGPLSTSDGPIH